MPSTKQRKHNIKLLAALESKNGKAWVAMYEDNTFSKPSYYCTMHNGGEHLGTELKAAATRVMEIAASVKPKVYRLDLAPDVQTRFQ
jgi:hypothetical protein